MIVDGFILKKRDIFIWNKFTILNLIYLTKKLLRLKQK